MPGIAQPSCNLIDALLLDVGEEDRCAGCRQTRRDRLADALRGAGHDRDASVETGLEFPSVDHGASVSWTRRPARNVFHASKDLMSAAGVACRSPSTTTTSASFPGSIEPIRSSSRRANAASIV